MTAERRGLEPSPDEQHGSLGAVRELPPHSDCVEGLRRLRDAGFRMTALTKSTAEVAQGRLGYAGLL